MRKTAVVFVLLASTLALGGCASFPYGPGGGSSALNTPARYQGKLPCADCAGIKVVLNVFPDHSYLLERTYLGTPDKSTRSFSAGQWTLAADSDRLTLTPVSGNAQLWQVAGNGTLEALMANGQPPTSGLNYTIKRTGQPVTRTLANTHWKLVRLQDQYVGLEVQAHAAYVVLHNAKSRVSGADGCNRIMGNYDSGDGSLAFSQLASTMMACPGPAMKIEQAFNAMLGKVASYRLMGNYLAVYDGNDQPLAVFRAVDMQ